MPRRLRYIAQPFWDGRPGEPLPFLCAMDAEEGGRLLMSQADGVLVFQQWADEEPGLCDDPEILVVMGDVPASALQVDPPAPDIETAYFKIECGEAGDTWSQIEWPDPDFAPSDPWDADADAA
jgi:hypothetical protein